jgi:glycosyltransferase involved in cell wall biosynthesis
MPHSAPLVSVIIPTHNLQEYVAETLDSVLGQLGDVDFEVVTVDDRSTDATLSILEAYAEKDSRVQVFQNSGRRGAAGARNFGIQQARGKWISFLDGDDLWEPDNLALKMAAAKQFPAAQLISSDFINENAANRTLRRDEWPGARHSLRASWRRHISPCSVEAHPTLIQSPANIFIEEEPVGNTGTIVVSRELLNTEGGFDEGIEVGEDVFLWIKLASRIDHMIYLPKPLMYYRYRPKSLTNQGIPTYAFCAEVYFKRLLLLPEFSNHRAALQKRISASTLAKTYYFRRSGHRLLAVISAIKGMRYGWADPLCWKNLAAALAMQ